MNGGVSLAEYWVLLEAEGLGQGLAWLVVSAPVTC